MKLKGLFCLLLFAVSLAGAAEIEEQQGGFTYTLPAGWFRRDVPGETIKMAFGPDRPAGNPFISFRVLTMTGNLAQAQAAGFKELRSGFEDAGITNFKIVRQSSFDTDAEEIGLRAVIQSTRQDGQNVR